MDMMIYFPKVLGLFNSGVTCSISSAALECNAFLVIFYCIAMLVTYCAFMLALRYTYEQNAIKSKLNRKTQSQPTVTNAKIRQATTPDPVSYIDSVIDVELTNRINKILYQL